MRPVNSSLLRTSAFVLLAAVLGCAGASSESGSSGAPSAATPADYFPLGIGSTWTFLDRSPQQADAMRRTVTILRRDAEGYFVDDQRGELRADPDCLHDRSRRLLCGPIAAGTKWRSVVSPTATEYYEIAAVGETVRVPAGTFKGCVRVRSQLRAGGMEQIAELTYAPGVGPVQLETFAVVKGVAHPQIRGVLESYRIVGEK
jgi:hypothetical protein